MTIAEQGSLLFPESSVTNRPPDQSVSDLVKQHLMDLIQICRRNKMLAQSDSLLGVVTLTGSSDRSIEAKRVVDYSVSLE